MKPRNAIFGRFAFGGRACAAVLAVTGAGCGPFSPTLLSPSSSADSGSVTGAPTTDNNQVSTRASDGSVMTKPLGKVAMTGCVSFDYFAPFSLGGSAVSLLVDSGSTTLAAASATCTTCGVDATYRQSATGKSTGKTTSSSYLDGSQWSGTIFTDDALAGSAAQPSTPNVTLAFAAITQQRGFFSSVTCAAADDTKFDGIVGMGPDTLLTTGTTSFLSLLGQSASEAVDAFALQTCDVGGTLWFGGYDVAATSAAATYTPMLQNRAYAVSVSAMALGDTDLGLDAAQIGPMVVDNGTNAILLPSAAFAAFEQVIEKNPVYLANFGGNFISAQAASCAAPTQGLTRAQLDAALPPLSMTFPNQAGGFFSVEVPATSSYLVAGVSADDASKTVIYCPAITASSSSTISIIGNAFMRNHVVIFDRTGKRIGFAPQVGCKPQTVVYNTGT